MAEKRTWKMKFKFFVIIVVVTIGMVLSYMHSQIVFSYSKNKFEKYEKMIHLEGNSERINFYLSQDAYTLKIKHIIQEKQQKKIFVNTHQVIPHHIRKRGIIETTYVHLPKDIMKSGKNIIDIYFSNNYPPDVDIRIYNYVKEMEGGIYILNSDSANLPSGKISCKITIFIVLLVFLFFSLGIYLLSNLLFLSIDRLFLYQVYSLLPFLIFLFCFSVIFNLSQSYKAVVSHNYFWTFGLVSFSVTQSCIVLRKLLQSYRSRKRNRKLLIMNPRASRKRDRKPWIINPRVIRAFDWIKMREFSDKCILLFMALLIFCVFSLILHLEFIAKQVANFAYFALVVGVVVNFMKLIKEER